MKMQIGQVMTDKSMAGKRDAFHVAGVMAFSWTPSLSPGDNVRFTDDSFTCVTRCLDDDRKHGVVDPFIKEPIKSGDLFLVLLDPDKVSVMSHQFTITVPEFEDKKILDSLAKLGVQSEIENDDDPEDCNGRGC